MTKLVPIIALLIAFGLFFGYVSPTYTGSVAAKKAEIASFEGALEAADAFKAKEAQLAAARAAISPEALARLDGFLPDGVDNVQLILDLDALADRTGMKLADFDTLESADVLPTQGAGTFSIADQDPVDSLDLTMTGSGSYAAFRDFLTGIEESLRPLDVVAVSVASSQTGVYAYEITLRLYWLR